VFANGTKDTSANPAFTFNNPGTYTVNLAVTNACGTVNSTKIIVVKAPPKVTLPNYANACATITFNPGTGLNVTNCGSNTLTYLWTFAGGTPATSTSADPGVVTFNTPGINTVTLEVTNECGTTTVTKSFSIAPAPNLTVAANDTLCAGTAAGPYPFNSTTSSVTFSWTNNNTTIGLGLTGTGNSIPSFIATNGTTNPITALITVSASSGGCPT
jgi:PKD repeat protein